MRNLKRWRGLKDLLRDATQHGASAVQRVHLETARRPFGVLEQIPPIAAPARTIHQLHDAAVSTTYDTVRLATRALDRLADLALDALDDAGQGS